MISQLSTTLAISLNPITPKPFSILLPPKPKLRIPPILSSYSNSSSAAASTAAQIDLSLNPTTGVFTSHSPLVVVLWDLDNKPPRGPPYQAALALRRLAELFGRVDSISAYANRHAFSHLPQWVAQHRRQQRHQDILERKGLSIPSMPYVCSVCGRKFNTNLNLKSHFKNLHERERKKKLARLSCLKGKKRQKYKERFISGNVKYEEAARQLLTPKNGYGLATELRRAGVYVKTVEDKPQAADAAVKRQMMHSMARGIDWVVLVSDDSDFGEMIRRARENDLRTVVVGDGRNALGKHADLWIPWVKVENGEIGEEVLSSGRRNVDWDEENDLRTVVVGDGRNALGKHADLWVPWVKVENGEVGEEVLSSGRRTVDWDVENDEGVFLNASFYEGGDVDDELKGVVDDIVGRSLLEFGGGGTSKVPAFSEEEDFFGVFGPGLNGRDLVSDSDEEEDYYI